MESIWRQIIDWIFVGTYTEDPAQEELEESDPLAGNRDGLGNIAAPEDDRGTSL